MNLCSGHSFLFFFSSYCSTSGEGAWSGWGSWSSCSRTCNGGTQRRKRTCIGDTVCPGNDIQEQDCNTEECPISTCINSVTPSHRMSYSNINSYCLSVMDGVCSLVNVTLIASYVSMSIRTKSSFLSSLIHGFFDCCVCVLFHQ